MISPIKYFRPNSIKESLELLNELPDGKNILAGGTDLLIGLRRNYHSNLTNLIDISYLQDLKKIKESDSKIIIGSSVTHSQIVRSKIIQKWTPILSEASSKIGSVQIRNRGTIGGNVCNASPCADTVPVLLALNTQVNIQSKDKSFFVPLEQFILAPYQTILNPNEMVVGFSIPKLPKNTGFEFIKLGRRNAMSIARMNVATVMQIQNGKIFDIRLAVGSVMPSATRVKRVEEMLIDQMPSSKIFEKAGREVADEMIRVSGRRWSAEYKEPVISVLVKRALEKAFQKISTGN